MRLASLLFFASLVLASCQSSEAPPGRASGAFSLIDKIEDVEAFYDDKLFRSVRKDGSLVHAITLDGRTELSLTPPVPSTLHYRLRIPDDPILRFATAAATAGDENLIASIELSMRIVVDGTETEVFSDLVRRRAANTWRDHEVDLGPWSGRSVELVLTTDWKTKRAHKQPVLASWGNPVIAEGGVPTTGPHLVVISIDCLRADHVGVYGYEKDTTPSINAFAKDGTVFENAFATASWTLPTHMSMLTGLLPSFHGATKWEKLASSVTYLPELLAGSGYRTSGVVSWVYLSQAYGFERGYHTYRVLDDPEASDIAEAAIEELRRGEGQPQFLFVHLYDPHWPYLPPTGRFREFGARPRDISALLDMTSRGQAPPDEEAIEEVQRLYDSEIAFADHELGRLFQALKDEGMYDDALIVVTADHGEAFYEHGHWQHTVTMFDEILHVPLIVKWPGNTKTGRFDGLVSQMDIFTTVLEAAGVELPGTEEGFLARPSLASSDPSPRTLLSEVTWRSPNGTTMKVSIRDERVKYIATLEGPAGDDLGVNEVAREELYDLIADPEETQNLLLSDDALAQPYRAKLRAFLDDARAARSLRSGEAVELDDETLKKLESLGYTH